MQVIDASTVARIDLTQPHLIILSINDRSSGGNLATALPDSELAVLYYVNARNPGILRKVHEMHASVLGHIFPSSDGSAIAYLEENLARGTSLYVLSLREGFRLRILSLSETAPRGIPLRPNWSPDARQLAVSIATDYDMDLFAFELANNQWRPLTRGGGYDFHPVWSPDGRYLAYLSDIARCPTWQPSSPESCNSLEATPPRRGQLHILDLQTGASQRLSEVWLSEPPHWLDETTLTFVSGDLLYGETERILWLANTVTGTTRRLLTNESEAIPPPLDVFWAADGSAVVYQSAGTENRIVAVRADGVLLGSSDEFIFPRYGMAAAWAPDGLRLAIGGVEGQCPFGALVFTRELQLIAQGTIPPMCEPKFSPDGDYLAFEGVNSLLDGRIHVYRASVNGFGALNLTEGLRGQNRLIGWASGR